MFCLFNHRNAHIQCLDNRRTERTNVALTGGSSFLERCDAGNLRADEIEKRGREEVAVMSAPTRKSLRVQLSYRRPCQIKNC